MKAPSLLPIIALLFLAALNPLRAQHHTPVPGEKKDARTAILETGAEMLQNEAPLKAIHAHVCGFHFYNGDRQRQVIAHHYCSHLSDEVMQCVIYDSDRKNARLIGIEYIISRRLFEALPAEEKKYWHSHVHEVKSGQLIAPRLPDVAERELMKDLVDTYGKTIHTWQFDVHPDLPLGAPQLMMGFTAEGQAHQKLVDDRDAGYGIQSADKKAKRTDLPTPVVAEGADAWQSGQALQLEAREVKAK